MVELDAGIAAQMALAQQRAALGILKQSAQADRQVAEIVAQTIAASNSGKTVDLYA
jgi:hypothetical protein